MSHTRTAALTGLFAFALLIGCSAPPAAADNDAPKRTISVSGEAERTAPPDLATITLGVESEADTAAAALTANNGDMANILSTLKGQGLEDRDIQTSSFNISPRYRQYPRGESGPSEIVGYTVSNQVTVRVRDLSKLGEVMDMVVRTGANRFQGINFAIDKPDALLDEARKDAVADARRKAEILATAAGARLGEVMTISEGGHYVRDIQPAMYMRESVAASVPVAAGEQSLSVSVSITYALE